MRQSAGQDLLRRCRQRHIGRADPGIPARVTPLQKFLRHIKRIVRLGHDPAHFQKHIGGDELTQGPVVPHGVPGAGHSLGKHGLFQAVCQVRGPKGHKGVAAHDDQVTLPDGAGHLSPLPAQDAVVPGNGHHLGNGLRNVLQQGGPGLLHRDAERQRAKGRAIPPQDGGKGRFGIVPAAVRHDGKLRCQQRSHDAPPPGRSLRCGSENRSPISLSKQSGS